jgi:hypothetical protein
LEDGWSGVGFKTQRPKVFTFLSACSDNFNRLPRVNTAVLAKLGYDSGESMTVTIKRQAFAHPDFVARLSPGGPLKLS